MMNNNLRVEVLRQDGTFVESHMAHQVTMRWVGEFPFSCIYTASRSYLYDLRKYLIIVKEATSK